MDSMYLAPQGYEPDGTSREWRPVIIIGACGPDDSIARVQDVETGEVDFVPFYGLRAEEFKS